MSSITPLSAEAISTKLQNEYQSVWFASLTALAGGVIGILAAHGPAFGIPVAVTSLISGLLVLTGAALASRGMSTAREFLPVSRSKEIEIQDTLARQSPEIREYVESVRRTRGGLVNHDLAIIKQLAVRNPK